MRFNLGNLAFCDSRNLLGGGSERILKRAKILWIDLSLGTGYTEFQYIVV